MAQVNAITGEPVTLSRNFTKISRNNYLNLDDGKSYTEEQFQEATGGETFLHKLFGHWI